MKTCGSRQKVNVSVLKRFLLRQEVDTGVLPTGIPQFDLMLPGGLPRGKITEIIGGVSSGKSSLTCSILTQATVCGELVAYIDPTASLDPYFAQKAGVDLRYFLWIRGKFGLRKALKAVDILVRAGRFGTVVLDLDTWRKNLSHGMISRISFQIWFRLQRVIRGTPTVLLLLGNEAVAGSASSLVISLSRRTAQWGSTTQDTQTGENYPKYAHYLKGIVSQADFFPRRHLDYVTFYCRL